MRKIIQIVEIPDQPKQGGWLTALCDDGTIWYYSNSTWTQLLPLIPQDEE
jgi:hypothetical protein